MKQKKLYITDDGKEFEDRTLALEHEKKVKADGSLRSFFLRYTRWKKPEDDATLDEIVDANLYDSTPAEIVRAVLDAMKAHPVEATSALKGTFSIGKGPKKTPAKKVAKKVAAKSDGKPEAPADKPASDKPASDKPASNKSESATEAAPPPPPAAPSKKVTPPPPRKTKQEPD